MNPFSLKKKGFTLIELMLVVAIIGILAAIAVPNFMKYQAKAKQTEAKTNLKGIYSVETSYFSENNFYSKEFDTGLQWVPVGPYRYAYGMGGAVAGLPLSPSLAENAGTPDAGPYGFTAVAWGNIDSDPTYDTWQITSFSPLTNTRDDVSD